jgi:cytochrome b561
VAALAVIVISLGWAIGGAPRNTPSRDLLLLLHRSVGLVILAAMLFRAGQRWHTAANASQQPPVAGGNRHPPRRAISGLSLCGAERHGRLAAPHR